MTEAFGSPVKLSPVSRPTNLRGEGYRGLFRNLQIFSRMSVLENVMVGRHRHERTGIFADLFHWPSVARQNQATVKAARVALARVDLADSAGRPAGSLAYGALKRLEIARALASEPTLLLLDEPAAGCNPVETEEIDSVIRSIVKDGITVVLVEHDMRLVMNISSRIHVLASGRTLTEGTPEQVRVQCGSGPGVSGYSRFTGGRIVLSIENVKSAYGRIEVLHGVTLYVDVGEIVTLIGANGAGKTTLMRAISGVQPITDGSIRFKSVPIEQQSAHARVASGISQVPEGRQVFEPLSVKDNLRLGAWRRRDADVERDLARVCALFPMLEAIWEMPAGALSGGQQQMLAIGRALMAKPQLLLLDEPSMGLAPNLVDHVLSVIRALKNDRLTILLVEQNARAALSIADRAYVMETGKVTLSGAAAEIQADHRVREAYLGI